MQSPPPVHGERLIGSRPTPDCGWLIIFFGTLFVLIFAYGAIGYARNQWHPSVRDIEIKPNVSGQQTAEVGLIAVRGKIFRNCEVTLDGREYTQCEFHTVTLVYDGGPVGMIDNKFVDGFVMRSNKKDINSFVSMMNAFGFLKISAVNERGVVAPTNPFPGLDFHSSGKMNVPR